MSDADKVRESALAAMSMAPMSMANDEYGRALMQMRLLAKPESQYGRVINGDTAFYQCSFPATPPHETWLEQLDPNFLNYKNEAWAEAIFKVWTHLISRRNYDFGDSSWREVVHHFIHNEEDRANLDAAYRLGGYESAVDTVIPVYDLGARWHRRLIRAVKGFFNP